MQAKMYLQNICTCKARIKKNGSIPSPWRRPQLNKKEYLVKREYLNTSKD